MVQSSSTSKRNSNILNIYREFIPHSKKNNNAHNHLWIFTRNTTTIKLVMSKTLTLCVHYTGLFQAFSNEHTSKGIPHYHRVTQQQCDQHQCWFYQVPSLGHKVESHHMGFPLYVPCFRHWQVVLLVQ